MIVAGIGCRKGTEEAEVLAAIDAALAAHGLSRAALGALAVLPQKQNEPAIGAAARTLGVDVIVSTAIGKETLTKSPHSLAATGTGSASEAAALAGAGEGAYLLGPRVIANGATCALASTEHRS
ncbi:MAG: cobalamin biosynthesis protein [Mesorhizobium sp.]|nr:cobalamin biosynthesis protein [Mesorhizobium sp.]